MGAKKIKPVKAISKKPVVVQDTFQERVKLWVEKNYSVVVGVGAAILFIMLSTWGFAAYEKSKLSNAQADYTSLASRFPVDGKSSTADWEKLIPDLQNFISRHKSTSLATDARIELAKAFFQAKRYDDAIKTGTEVLGSLSAGSTLKPLVHYQLAYAYEASGKIEQASAEWINLKNMNLPGMEREIAWNLGKFYAGKKDFTKAQEMYQLAAKSPGDFPQPALIDQALIGIRPEMPYQEKSPKQ